ncbi:helix-turn-helix domain-containing protein [Actinomadura flavalba]|uniref:helix-turn-helix domain-containing protein n=1 Tax=Actinomadura flavalba TaxID=1120938 RepID=UPI00037418D6|nr:helix-turn-helix transcriptional regulator [Actinomadura flavalba]
MPAASSSSAQQARRALAGRLRELRLDAGMNAIELARAAGWDRTKVSHIEHARRSPSEADIDTWCRACGAEDQAADLVASLRAVEGMWIEWRRMERSGLRRSQEAVRPLFERTRTFRAYSSWLVPGLIQTEGYTRAVLRAVAARRGLVDDVEAAVAVRMERQHVLMKGGPTFSFLLEESVLRTGVGGAEVMAGQLGRLVEVGALPSVSLGVVPARPDRDDARPVEDFWIFDNEQVSVELVSGYLTITQPREITLYTQMFHSLAKAAVFGSAARSLIKDVGASLG